RNRSWHRFRSGGPVSGQPCHPWALDCFVEPAVGAMVAVALRLRLQPAAVQPSRAYRAGGHRGWAFRLLLDVVGTVRRRSRKFEPTGCQRAAVVEFLDHRRGPGDRPPLRLAWPALAYSTSMAERGTRGRSVLSGALGRDGRKPGFPRVVQS